MAKRCFYSKKAQAAMEYIHTYGWVLLAATVIGGVLLYFNISNAAQMVPIRCTFLSGIECRDFIIEESLLSIDIVNGFGFALSNVTLAVNGTCNSTANTTDGNMFGNLNVLLENQQTRYIFECQNLTNMRVEETLTFGFINTKTGQEHLKFGHLQYSPTGG